MQDDAVVKRIEANPKYLELRSKRNRLGWTLTIIMLLAYYGYVALIAFDKAFLAKPMGAGVTTIGIPIAVGLIVYTILITLVYIRRANNEFDRLTEEVVKEATR